MDFKKIYNSKALKIAVIALGAAIYGLVIFKAGIAIGLNKARFSYALGDNYRDIFTNGPPRPFDKIDDLVFPNANGAAGKIIRVDDPFIFIEEPNNSEKIISTDANTSIRLFREQIPFSSLSLDQSVVVVGEPSDDGMISARLIRVMPSPLPLP